MALTATDKPISLLSPHVQTVHTDILKTRMEKVLNENQRGKQDGFRMGYSTVDHFQATNQLIEKCHEFKRPGPFALDMLTMKRHLTPQNMKHYLRH